MGGDARVEPGLAGADVLGVHGQPGLQVEAALGGDRAQPLERGPGALGVDVVGGQRRDAAPVVDAGVEQGPALGEVDEVGRRLHAGLGPEHEAGDGDRGAVVVEVEVVGVAHRGVGLGAEVLDDHLLHRAELGRDLAQREDRLGPLGEGLADADEQAGGEGDREAAGVLEDPQPDGGVLVGGAEVGLALGLEQPARGGLEHHPHRGRDRLEPVHLLPRHDAGVEVGQQPGLLEHPHRHRADVGERGVVALRVEPLPGLGPAVLGPVAEGEQRLEAAQLGALAGDLEDLVGGEERLAALAGGLARGLDERAVVAPVAAQLGDRDEHLGGVGHDARAAGGDQARVAHPGRGGGQPVEVGAGRGQQHGRLGHVEGGAPLGPRECAAYLLGGGGRLGLTQRNAVGRGIPRPTHW